MVGHSTSQITFKHYARFIKDDLNLNEKRLEEFLSSHDSVQIETSEQAYFLAGLCTDLCTGRLKQKSLHGLTKQADVFKAQ